MVPHRYSTKREVINSRGSLGESVDARRVGEGAPVFSSLIIVAGISCHVLVQMYSAVERLSVSTNMLVGYSGAMRSSSSMRDIVLITVFPIWTELILLSMSSRNVDFLDGLI